MTSVELLADALRFFLLYTLLPNGAIAVSLEDAAVIGAVAGIANQLVSICIYSLFLIHLFTYSFFYLFSYQI